MYIVDFVRQILWQGKKSHYGHLECLAVADILSRTKLRKEIIEWISKSYGEPQELEGYKEFKQHYPKLIMEILEEFVKIWTNYTLDTYLEII